MSIKVRREDALDYHAKGKPGKIEALPKGAAETAPLLPSF